MSSLPIPTDRPILMIPGPIEISPAVREAYSIPPLNHVGEPFISLFSEALKKMRKVWKADDTAQPFIIAGSGTLGMEVAVYNLTDPGERALVLVTGYFGDRFVDMCTRAQLDTVRLAADLGYGVTEEQLRGALKEAADAGKPFKVVFVTHVDTSTSVKMDPEMVCRVAREYNALSVVDGVCAAVSERFEFAKWDADVYLTGSQKAVGAACGLSLFVASARALNARAQKKSLPPMYMDFEKWIPVLKGYEAKTPLYFATPATTLIPAVNKSFDEVLSPSIDATFERHELVGQAIRAAYKAMGLRIVPVQEHWASNSMSAVWAPEGLDVAAMLLKAKEKGVQLAGGLHPDLKGKSFRVGHMGFVVTQPEWIYKTVDVLEQSLAECGAFKYTGAAVAAAKKF